MIEDKTLKWLLEGDISIQYQTYRDLLDIDKPELRKKIQFEGWGKQFLSCRQASGYWGKSFYQPKWTCSHYTLLDLRNLNILPIPEITETLELIFTKEKCSDGGINPAESLKQSDVCINGMTLNYSSYFQINEKYLKSVIDFLLSEIMPDGGFNCHSNRKGATHSSVHTTLSVLEGFAEYKKSYTYRLNEIVEAEKEAQEFLLMHKLFRSDKTGQIMNPKFLRFPFPCRWYYDILKAMDYFQMVNIKDDIRMNEAINVILAKKTKENQWKLSSKYLGATHFDMEESGKPSRWNTLRALRVLKRYEKHNS